MRFKVRLAAVALAVLSPALADAAPEPKTVLLLPLEHPNLPEEVARALDQALRAEVEKALPKLELLPAPKLDFQAMRLAAGCSDDGPGCLTTIAKELGAGRVLRAQLTGSAKKATLKLTLVRAQTGKADNLPTAELRELAVESAPELRYHVAKAFGGKPAPLFGSLDLTATGRDPSLEGAEYFLDDEKVAAKALQKVSPGDHRLSVHRPGYESVIWMGEVLPGRKTAVKIEWKAAAAAPPPPPALAVTPAADPKQGVPKVEAPPPKSPPPPVEPPPALVTEAPPRLVFTWIFATGALVAGATWGVLGAQVLDRENRAVNERLNCEDEMDINNATCSGGRKLATFTNVAIAATGVFVGATVAAFFLEDGPTVLFGDGPPAQAGIGPTADGRGVAAAVSLRF